MQALEIDAKEKETSKIFLHVFAHNQIAFNLYQKVGFRVVKNYLDKKGTKIISYRMVKKSELIIITGKDEIINQEKKEELLKLAVKGSENAHCPYSHFRVGAAVLGKSGKVYLVAISKMFLMVLRYVPSAWRSGRQCRKGKRIRCHRGGRPEPKKPIPVPNAAR
jgi:hypothetical protein